MKTIKFKTIETEPLTESIILKFSVIQKKKEERDYILEISIHKNKLSFEINGVQLINIGRRENAFKKMKVLKERLPQILSILDNIEEEIDIEIDDG